MGEDQCAILVNNEAARVLYKNNYAFGATLFNIYMVDTPIPSPPN